jgi:hypothetical protein
MNQERYHYINTLSPNQNINLRTKNLNFLFFIVIFILFLNLSEFRNNNYYGSRPYVGPWQFFSVLIPYTVGRNLLTGDQPVARPLPKHTTTQKQNKRTHTSMP